MLSGGFFSSFLPFITEPLEIKADQISSVLAAALARTGVLVVFVTSVDPHRGNLYAEGHGKAPNRSRASVLDPPPPPPPPRGAGFWFLSYGKSSISPNCRNRFLGPC